MLSLSMLQYTRRLQGNSKIKGSSITLAVPAPLLDIMSWTKGDIVVLELARHNDEKIIVLRKFQKEELENTNTTPNLKVNVIT